MDVGMNKAKDEKMSVILRVGLGIIFAVRQFPVIFSDVDNLFTTPLLEIQVSSMFPDGNDFIYSYPSLDRPRYEDDNLHCLTCIDEDNDWFNLFSDLNGLENRNPFLDRP
ncbi:hypothetical protein T07_12667 [Trichinella nelsoni]|uniref:Uncharacterized protein n=1 Tax=Trichinella nelsoni TaxID=6336 RepID=A0A0V0SGY6_9BILA|nr:hypothetical protein T07_12667 [Trichinella nelsoni]